MMTVQLPAGDWHIDRGAPFRFKETAAGINLPPHQALFAVPATQET
jgi:hypothetical protein